MNEDKKMDDSGGGRGGATKQPTTPNGNHDDHHHHNHNHHYQQQQQQHLHHQKTSPFSLRWRLQLTVVMLALESYISFEEIFMLPILQRVKVPLLFVSLPGTISSAIGIFVIPFLGWASDRMFCCSKYCGQKRPFAVWTLAVAVIGVGILVYVSAASLYEDTLNDDGMSNNSYNSSPSLPVVAYLDNSTAADLREMESADLQALMDNTSSKTSLQPFPSMVSGPFSLLPGQNDDNSSVTLVSLPPSQYQQSTETAHNASTNASTTSEYLTTIGILGIVGFVLSDHGYDSSMSTFKAYMVAVTPASQQNNIFILGTLTGAVGGCVTSLLGFVDLGVLLPEEDGEVLDKGMAQGLIQALILLISFVVLGCVSLVTGSESSSHACGFESSIEEGDTDIDQCKNVSKDSVTKPPIVATTSNDTIKENENMPLIYERSTQGCCCAQLSTFWRRWKRRFLLCSMTFMGLCTNYSYFVYVSNYVAEVIFYGDPNADTESEAYANYVKGVHVASLGMLAFYLLFVVFNVFHQKILDKIGMRREYLGSSVCCAALMLLLAATDSIVFFFLNAVTMATFRAAVYTVPFILSNNLAKEEAKETKGNSVDSSGVAMATISAMIPGSYFVVSLVMGPLMDATRNPGMPIIVAAGSCIMNFVVALFVRFD